MKFISLALVALAVTGCASTHMKQYIGKDIREVILDAGPPVNVLDMGDGARAFQFKWGGGTFTMPTVTTSSGTVTSAGNQAYLNSTAITSGGTFSSPGCVLSYMTTWDAATNGWVVRTVRPPKELVC